MFRRKKTKSAISDDLRALYPRLWRYALVLTGARDWADEVAQTACVKALEKEHQFECGSRLDRWVFRIAQRVWYNEVRAQAVRRGGGLVAIESADLIDTALDVDANYFVRQVISQVMALPEAQRIAVLLVYVEGYSYQEAAEIMEIPKGTVMSRLAAARSKLAHRMRESAVENG
ncbi:MAG: RNA polymerase sigma factor [Kiloniellales bacterium]